MLLQVLLSCLSVTGVLARPQNWGDWDTPAGSLNIQTNNGIVRGFVNATSPDVRQFLAVPYALPPTGERRWLPPSSRPASRTAVIDATHFPPSCPQYPSKQPSIYNQIVPEFLAVKNTDDQYNKTSEDCLYLAIWTPLSAHHDSKQPVIMFMTGGAFVTGGIDIDYQLPHHWVQRTQSHIVVTINYRLNIFGFPNARGLQSQNLGVLDQRAALEWVRDNIQAFGGDPARITLWGQSAGAASVDFHNFAFPQDPIASGLVLNSGSVLLGIASIDTGNTNFTFVASGLGCGKLDAQAELQCMRAIEFQRIEDFIGNYSDTQTVDQSLPSLSFYPVPDEKIVFSNYTQRYSLGAFSNLPAVFTSTTNDGLPVVPYPSDIAAGPNTTLVYGATLLLFTCPAATSVRSRTAQGRLTYRWQFAGNYSNVSPLPWMGAYHSSDLAYEFGTHQDFRSSSTESEFETANSMQDHILAFMQNPIAGPAELGWQSTASGNMLLFGSGGVPVQTISQQSVDQACSALG